MFYHYFFHKCFQIIFVYTHTPFFQVKHTLYGVLSAMVKYREDGVSAEEGTWPGCRVCVICEGSSGKPPWSILTHSTRIFKHESLREKMLEWWKQGGKAAAAGEEAGQVGK